MLVSDVLTTGQIAFILRVVIQILSIGGLFLVGTIILGNAPRVASISTHDVLSRIASKETLTSTCMKWLLLRPRKANDPTSTSKLVPGVLLMLSLSLFVKLADLGFLGLHTCTTPDNTSFHDNPASVSNDNTARALLNRNILNGTDPSSIKYFRCEATQTIELNGNETLNSCTQWTNSTYADKSIFIGLNRSDTTVLMPHQLSGRPHRQSERPCASDLNGYYYGPLFQRILKPTIMNGIVVVPHETGFRAFIGVPDLQPYHRVVLPHALAIESDIGCMTIGMYTQQNMSALLGLPIPDIFRTNDSRPFRQYVGPDYLEEEVSRTVDETREYLKPMWNMSTLLDNGLVVGINELFISVTTAANVLPYSLPQRPHDNFTTSRDASLSIFGNCSQRLGSQLNLVGTPLAPGAVPGKSCGLLGFGGSEIFEGSLFGVVSRVVCATTTQVNLVDAEVEVNRMGDVMISYQRLPSDLHVTLADYWSTTPQTVASDNNTCITWDVLHRYALSPNPSGETQHFIPPQTSFLQTGHSDGVGNGASIIPQLTDIMTNPDDNEFQVGVFYLEDGYDGVDFDLAAARVAKWAGQFGASYLLGSISYNGWAANALADGPLTVFSTAGKQATCYNPLYAITFIPLILATIFIVIMVIKMLLTTELFKAGKMKTNYAGLRPYQSAVLPSDTIHDKTLLFWEKGGDPHLILVQDGQVLQLRGNRSAVEYLYMGKE